MAEKGTPKRGMGPKPDHAYTRAEVKQGSKKKARRDAFDQGELDTWWAETTKSGKVIWEP